MSYDLLLDDHHGIFIPKIFAEEYHGFEGIDQTDLDTCLAGPYNEGYWDAWQNIVDNAVCVDKYSREWRLYQDGALWAYCPATMTSEDEKNLFGC